MGSKSDTSSASHAGKNKPVPRKARMLRCIQKFAFVERLPNGIYVLRERETSKVLGTFESNSAAIDFGIKKGYVIALKGNNANRLH